MKQFLLMSLMLTIGAASPMSATVLISAPSNGATVSSSATFIASAISSTCSKGVASMGIYIDNQSAYVGNGTSLKTTLPIAPGSHTAAVQEWDFCGGSTLSQIGLTGVNLSNVSVSSPANGATISTQASFIATASTNCPAGVASMGVYVDGVLAYVTPGASLNTQLSVGLGSHVTVVKSWDFCGGVGATTVNLTVVGTTLSNLQAAAGWNQWGELPPVYDICPAPCPGVSWLMTQKIKSPSLSGSATKFDIGGTNAYADVLWSNPLIGQGAIPSRQDASHTYMPTLHNFIMDTDFYVTNSAVTQDLEFDVNMYLNGVGMEWGTECNNLYGGVWDIWNNIAIQWVHTTIPCTLKQNAWNHFNLLVQRLPNNVLLYQTLTVNGVAYPINQTVVPFPVPQSWYGVTVNYQMDGNYRMAANTTYLDNLSVTYW